MNINKHKDKPTMKKRKWCRTILLLLISFVLGALVCGWAGRFLVTRVEKRLCNFLKERLQLPNAAMTLSVNTQSTNVLDLVLTDKAGKGIKADRLGVTYRLAQLMNKRVASLTVSGVDVQITRNSEGDYKLGRGGKSVRKLLSTTASSDTPDETGWCIDKVIFDHVRFVIQNPEASHLIRLNGEVAFDVGMRPRQARLRLQDDNGHLTATYNNQQDNEPGMLTVNGDLAVLPLLQFCGIDTTGLQTLRTGVNGKAIIKPDSNEIRRFNLEVSPKEFVYQHGDWRMTMRAPDQKEAAESVGPSVWAVTATSPNDLKVHGDGHAVLSKGSDRYSVSLDGFKLSLPTSQKKTAGWDKLSERFVESGVLVAFDQLRLSTVTETADLNLRLWNARLRLTINEQRRPESINVAPFQAALSANGEAFQLNAATTMHGRLVLDTTAQMSSLWSCAGGVIRGAASDAQFAMDLERVEAEFDLHTFPANLCVKSHFDNIHLDQHGEQTGLRNAAWHAVVAGYGVDKPITVENWINLPEMVFRGNKLGGAGLRLDWLNQEITLSAAWLQPALRNVRAAVNGRVSNLLPDIDKAVKYLNWHVALHHKKLHQLPLMHKTGLEIMPQFKGHLLASGSMKQQLDESHMDATIAVENGWLELPDDALSIQKIHGKIHFPQLPQLTSAPQEKWRVQKVELGEISLSELETTVQLESIDSFFCENIVFHWADGRVFVQPFRYRRAHDEYQINLFADRLNLASLLETLGLGMARGEGNLNGRITVRISEDGFDFVESRLFTTPGKGGKIKVTNANILPSGLPQSSTQYAQLDLAQAALKSFNYNWARINFETEGENLLLVLRMDGAPDRVLPFAPDESTGILRRSEEGPGVRLKKIDLKVNNRIPLNRLLGDWQSLKKLLEGNVSF